MGSPPGSFFISYNGDMAIDNTDPMIIMDLGETSLDVEFDYGVDIAGLTGFKGGDITITLPRGYTGGISFNDSICEIVINGWMFDSFGLSNFTGDVNIENCIINYFDAKSLTGDIDIEGSLGGFAIVNCLGDISIESDAAFVADCKFENCIGELSVDLPDGSGVNIIKDDYVGKVNIEGNNGSKKVDITLTDGVGEVDIEIGDR